MAKKPHEMEGADTLPSREDILSFLRGDHFLSQGPVESKKSKSKDDASQSIKTPRAQTQKVGKREIAKAFGIKGAARIALKALLKELETEGEVARRGKVLVKPGAIPPTLIATITSKDRDGDLIAKPHDWDEALSGRPPRLIIGASRGHKRRDSGPAPAVGDRVLLRLSDRREGTTIHAPVIKILSRDKAQMLGLFRSSPAGGGRLVPVDKKELGREAFVPIGFEGEAKDGDLVLANLGRKTSFGLMEARIVERIGPANSEKAVSLIALHAHHIPTEFSKATLDEAAQARPAGLEDCKPAREDWRNLPLVTIDPFDAKDHDDAVYAREDDDPDNAGGFVVTVAIADVSAYIRTGSSLDREALQRGNSVYFPDRVVPMLPERISNDLCSLRPLEDRPAMAVRLVLDADGHKRRHSFHRVLMRSAAKLSYQQAQAAIDGQVDETTRPLIDTVLKPLWKAWRTAMQARAQRAPLALDLPERKLVLKPDGSVDRVIVPERLDAHKVIEEFMILANVAAAETLESKRTPLIYRVHEEPSMEKMQTLGDVLASVGIKLTLQGALRPAFFNRILTMVEGGEHQLFINDVVLRSQAQAQYSPDNIGHFGLNLHKYAHFTSPIRRYADLIVHRALIRALRLGNDGLADQTISELAAISTDISAAERRAMAAERDTIDRLIAFHLASQIGAIFKGRVAGVTRSGLFVKLADTGADGYVPAASLGMDYYAYEEGLQALVGQGTGEAWRLGDQVEVKLIEAAPVAGALRFEMLSEGRMLSGSGGGKRAMRRGAGRNRPHLSQGGKSRQSKRPRGS
jgi:ribonuclease R